MNSTDNVSPAPQEAGTLPLSEDWFSNFNMLGRTASSPSDQPRPRPILSPSSSRPITSLPPSWSQQLLDVFISVHRNSEKGLNLVSKGIKALPEQLGVLKSLETIFLNSNQLETFPESIGDLTQLSMLFAHNNQLKTLPASLSTLEHLRFLDLHNNQLVELPNNFGAQLKRLTELIVFKNALRSLPPSITGMQHLVKLELQHNCLQQLPDSICALNSLQTLNVAHNELSSLPADMGAIKSMTRLDLSSNHLTSLPASMAQMKSLQSLWIDSNDLLEVPSPILAMNSLNLLSLRNNRIGPTLPIGLAKLSKLIYIWLNDNDIELLPEEIACMQNLQDLYLSHNPCYRNIPAPPNAKINPHPIPVPSSRRYMPTLSALAAKAVLNRARGNAPSDHRPRCSLAPYIESPDGTEVTHEVIAMVDTLEDSCTKCTDPCWGSGREHVYDEEWYPGQFIRIGWRHCWFCCQDH